MLSGLQEIVVVLILLCFIFLQRFLISRNKNNMIRLPYKKKFRLTRKQRLFIVGSLIWMIFFGIYLKPWNDEAITYIVIGVGPVILFWSFCWIKAGIE